MQLIKITTFENYIFFFFIIIIPIMVTKLFCINNISFFKHVLTYLEKSDFLKSHEKSKKFEQTLKRNATRARNFRTPLRTRAFQFPAESVSRTDNVKASRCSLRYQTTRRLISAAVLPDLYFVRKK